MGDYAVEGYRLQAYEITFYTGRKDNHPVTVRRAFANKDCANRWAIEVLHHNRQYVDYRIEKVK